MNNDPMDSTQNVPEERDIFEPFPAPRVWSFFTSIWAGEPHQKDTTDFMPSAQPAPPTTPAEITIIPKASIR
jgi:hypothetical protein